MAVKISVDGKIVSAETGGASLPVQVSGSILAEQQTEDNATEGVLTFSEDLDEIEIYNTDGTNDGVFTVNGIAVTVPKGKVWSGRVGGTPGKTVTVASATTYIVSRYEVS